jgi:hypothetical protein
MGIRDLASQRTGRFDSYPREHGLVGVAPAGALLQPPTSVAQAKRRITLRRLLAIYKADAKTTGTREGQSDLGRARNGLIIWGRLLTQATEVRNDIEALVVCSRAMRKVSVRRWKDFWSTRSRIAKRLVSGGRQISVSINKPWASAEVFDRALPAGPRADLLRLSRDLRRKTRSLELELLVSSFFIIKKRVNTPDRVLLRQLERRFYKEPFITGLIKPKWLKVRATYKRLKA